MFPIPSKFLIPFLEKSSLEEEGSPLVERWADLLASSASNPSTAHPRLVAILSEITGDQALLLQKIARNNIENVEFPNRDFHDSVLLYDPHYLYNDVVELLSPGDHNIENIMSFLDDMFSSARIGSIDIITRDELTEDHYSIPTSESFIDSNESEFDLNILYSLNILEEHTMRFSYKSWNITVIYVRTTSLGIEFIKRCDLEFVKLLESSKPKNP